MSNKLKGINKKILIGAIACTLLLPLLVILLFSNVRNGILGLGEGIFNEISTNNTEIKKNEENTNSLIEEGDETFQGVDTGNANSKIDEQVNNPTTDTTSEQTEKPKTEIPKVEEEKKTETPPDTTQNSNNWWEYPSTILPVTKSGNDLLVLVNKKYKLPSSYAPSDLVDVRQTGIRTKGGALYNVRRVMINDLKRMVTDFKSQGIDISVISSYRSYSTQQSTYSYWVSYNGGCVSCADKISARAGHSQHQLGTAIDFSTKEINDALGDSFTNTKAEKWLRSNAYKYGFALSYPSGYESTTGYSYESWHYRYIGVDNALEMKNSGLILEKYLQTK